MISECFWTAAAKHADIVLPATTSFERNDLTMTGDYSNQHLVPMKQVVPPRYEARNDFDVFAELSERWEKGGYARFTEGKSELQWLETFYNVARQRGASQQVELPPFAEFWQANQLIEMPENPDSERFIRFADFCRDPLAHPLKTASGKIEIFSQRIADYGYPDCLASNVAGAGRMAGQCRTRTVAGTFCPSGAPPAQPAELQFSARIVRGGKS